LLFLNRPILTNGALPPALKTLSVQPARGHCFSTISAASGPSGRLLGRGRTGRRGRPTPASGLAVPAADGIVRAPCRIACYWWSSARCARSARADRPAPPRRRWRGRRLPMASNCSFASTGPSEQFTSRLIAVWRDVPVQRLSSDAEFPTQITNHGFRLPHRRHSQS